MMATSSTMQSTTSPIGKSFREWYGDGGLLCSVEGLGIGREGVSDSLLEFMTTV